MGTPEFAVRAKSAGKDAVPCGPHAALGRSAPRSPAHTLLQCQRVLGNRATSGLIQAALTVNRPGDRYEQEADRIAAEAAKRFGANPLESAAAPAPRIAGMPSVGVSRSADGAAGSDAAPDVAARIEAARGAGQALPAGVRASMQRLFGVDFDAVRVHADAQADASSRALEARAFTTGRDIFFGGGQYQPTTRRGTELLAHELTHVVQQRAAASPQASNMLLRKPYEVQGAGGAAAKDRFETEDFVYAGQARERPTKLVAYLGPSIGQKETVDPISFRNPANTFDDIAGYHRGHLVGYSLRGPAEHYNTVPMLQRFNTSDWKKLENALDKGRKAAGAMGKYRVEITIAYLAAVDERVPTLFTVESKKKLADGTWQVDYGPQALPHKADEPVLSAPRTKEIADDLALVHGHSGDLKEKAALAWRDKLRGTYSFPPIDAANAAQELHDHWHLPVLKPPYHMLYPAYAIYRPYEELDLLYLAGKLPLPKSSIQQPFKAPFTKEQKSTIVEFNRARNGGRLMSDDQAEDPHKELKVAGKLDRPEIDHIIPTDRGGSNFFSNARVISYELNGKKDRIKNPAPYLLPGKVDRRVHPDLEEDVIDVLAALRAEPRPIAQIADEVFTRRGTGLAQRVKIGNDIEDFVKDLVIRGRVVRIGFDYQLSGPHSHRMDEF